MRIPPSLVSIARSLPSPLYVVGGWVRNMIAYGEPKGTDIDVCGALTPAELRKALADAPVKVVDVNPRIGTVLLSMGDDRYEYTTFRRDSYPLGGAHSPTDVTFVTDVKEDAKRRDFRCNAVYYDVRLGEVVDPLDGVSDIGKRLIRCTRTPREVFNEDGLRILRLVRLSARLGWKIDPDTYVTAHEMRKQLSDISAERRRVELDSILLADVAYGNEQGVRRGLELLSDLDLWEYLTGYVPSKARQVAASSLPPQAELRLSALLWDKSEEEIEAILGKDGLKYSNKQVDKTIAYRSIAIEALSDLYRAAAKGAGEIDQGASRLLGVMGYAQLANGLLVAEKTLLDDHVPLSPKELPLKADDLKKLGVPDRYLGVVLKELVLYSIDNRRKYSREEYLLKAKELKEKHTC